MIQNPSEIGLHSKNRYVIYSQVSKTIVKLDRIHPCEYVSWFHGGKGCKKLQN